IGKQQQQQQQQQAAHVGFSVVFGWSEAHGPLLTIFAVFLWVTLSRSPLSPYPVRSLRPV
uniref:U6 snRNA-associated Sm-like protein LSm2 n=1 Tax=Mesocestoides corti TaxID=53468 RepID=A0A5K3ET78_MESCO